ncbi:hypothetical protein ES703_95250 [subsurface metagenome]
MISSLLHSKIIEPFGAGERSGVSIFLLRLEIMFIKLKASEITFLFIG